MPLTPERGRERERERAGQNLMHVNGHKHTHTHTHTHRVATAIISYMYTVTFNNSEDSFTHNIHNIFSPEQPATLPYTLGHIHHSH